VLTIVVISMVVTVVVSMAGVAVMAVTAAMAVVAVMAMVAAAMTANMALAAQASNNATPNITFGVAASHTAGWDRRRGGLFPLSSRGSRPRVHNLRLFRIVQVVKVELGLVSQQLATWDPMRILHVWHHPHFRHQRILLMVELPHGDEVAVPDSKAINGSQIFGQSGSVIKFVLRRCSRVV